MALRCLLAPVTQAQASSIGVDSDPMALSWFHVIGSFVVTGILLFCGWIATMKRGQEELLPGMGEEEDRETNDYNSEKSSESRVNQGGQPEGYLEGHLHRAVQEGEDCVQGQQLQEVPDGEERVELPETLVSESEQVDVYFDVRQKTSRRIMLIVTMLIKGYKKGSYQEESVLKSIRHRRMTQKVNDSGNAYFVRRLLESLQADDMSSRELVHELETMVDVEHFTIDQELDFWGVITSSEEESEDDQSNLSLQHR